MNQTELSAKFSEETFAKITEGLVDREFTRDSRSISIDENARYLRSIKNLGVYQDLDLQVFTAQHSSENDARIGLSKELFSVLKRYSINNALIATHSNSDIWRYSLLTTNLKITDTGKVKHEFSNPRRYSYQLGPEAKTATPHKYLVKNGKVKDFDDLLERFSVEVVNNDFYKEIAALYLALVGSDNAPLNSWEARLVAELTSVKLIPSVGSSKHYEVTPLIKYPGSEEDCHEFAVKLLGRIVFCWFLREKKSASGMPLIPKTILSRAAMDRSNYYHSTLAPLFFEVLNKPLENRPASFRHGGFEQVPYLNGGLFSSDPLDHYRFDKELGASVPDTVEIKNQWLERLFDLLERFHFTIDENTSFDTDLSIDPEMLGRVFENLLARINPDTGDAVRRSTGSFYTPREIVDFMVDSSLVQYLQDKTSLKTEKLEALVSYDLLDDIGQELDGSEAKQVLLALSSLTVLDPACGSGAFPMGMLQKMVFVISILDPDARWWLNKQLEGASPELKREFSNKGVDYIRKLGIIRQTIFGVDIQPIATEISRLRCFLTLIVDEAIDDAQPNRGIRPLPNLDFKFVAANSLIKPPAEVSTKNTSLFESFSSKLSQKVSSYFGSNDQERLSLLNDIRDLIDSKVDQNIYYILNDRGIVKDERFIDAYNQKNRARNEKLMKEAEAWKSYKNIFNHKTVHFFAPEYFFPTIDEGVDIVIGNPPYIRLQKDRSKLASLYKDQGYSTFAGAGDIYSLFYERGLELSKQDTGLLCYITSNKWMKAGYGDKTRGLLASKNPLLLIDFAGFKVFDSASVDTNVLLVQNVSNGDGLEAVGFKGDYAKGQSIKQYFDNKKLSYTNPSSRPWFIGDKIDESIKGKIEAIGAPLKEWNVKTYYGIRTGYNKAFIVDKATKEMLTAEDPKSIEILKPILRGRDIGRYGTQYNDLYVLAVGYGDHATLHKQYPAVYNHLLRFEAELKNRGQCRYARNNSDAGQGYSGQHHWLELDNNPSREYFNEFGRDKIVWPETMRVHKTDSPNFPRFNLKPANVYLDKTCFMMNAPNKLLLLGIINSKLGWKMIDMYVDKLDNGGYMMQKAMVEKIPMPKLQSLPQEQAGKIESLVEQIVRARADGHDTSALESQVDKLVYEIYGLTENEIEVIEAQSG